jgi:hypothetical protein
MFHLFISTRAVCKVRGLTLLLWVGILWKCGDGLFFRSSSLGKWYTSCNAPPTSRKRAADRWSLRNFLPRNSLFMVGKAQKSHGTRSELNSVFDLERSIRTSVIQSRSRLMRFLGSSNHEKGAPRQKISKWSMVCSTFPRRGWSVEKLHRLPREILRKTDRHRTSTKFRLREIRWVHKLFKRPSYIKSCLYIYTLYPRSIIFTSWRRLPWFSLSLSRMVLFKFARTNNLKH